MSHYGITMYGMYYYRMNVIPWLTLAEKHRYVVDIGHCLVVDVLCVC